MTQLNVKQEVHLDNDGKDGDDDTLPSTTELYVLLALSAVFMVLYIIAIPISRIKI